MPENRIYREYRSANCDPVSAAVFKDISSNPGLHVYYKCCYLLPSVRIGSTGLLERNFYNINWLHGLLELRLDFINPRAERN